jgi:hypothetical protein
MSANRVFSSCFLRWVGLLRERDMIPTVKEPGVDELFWMRVKMLTGSWLISPRNLPPRVEWGLGRPRKSALQKPHVSAKETTR